MWNYSNCSTSSRERTWQESGSLQGIRCIHSVFWFYLGSTGLSPVILSSLKMSICRTDGPLLGPLNRTRRCSSASLCTPRSKVSTFLNKHYLMFQIHIIQGMVNIWRDKSSKICCMQRKLRKRSGNDFRIQRSTVMSKTTDNGSISEQPYPK